MDWQTPEDTVPSAFITEANARTLLGKPRATGAWREGDDPGNRRFVSIGASAAGNCPMCASPTRPSAP
jgi:homoserine O-acetyltransferase/O-succinyltransferase